MMRYEYVFVLWFYILITATYNYKKNKHCKKIFVSYIYILILEIIPLFSIYLMINNMLPEYLMRRNISFHIMLILVFLAIGMACYLTRIIKKIGDAYKKKNKMDEMPSMDRKLYYRSKVFGDEYAWIICLVLAVMSLVGLLWVVYTGDYGEKIIF